MNLKFTDLNALPDIKSTPQFDENGHTKRRREPFLQFDENGYAKKGNDVFSKFDEKDHAKIAGELAQLDEIDFTKGKWENSIFGEIKSVTENSDILQQPYKLESSMQGLVIDENGRIRAINSDLKGKRHSETGVPFVEKKVKTDTGQECTGVFPVFESVLDVQLPEDMQKESDKKQFAECNRQLKEKVLADPEFAKQFTEEQLEQSMNGDTPDGYTWHHNEETGKMQLVDAEIHARTGHTGGRAIWGGGSINR